MIAAATTTRVNHLLSAGTTYHGESSVAVVADGVLVGLHVVVPKRALLRVARGEFPILVRFVEALEKAALLLVSSRRGGRISGRSCRCR